MPYQIFNYVHNNQWCMQDLMYVGRVKDAVAIGENLIEIPRHPKLNKIDGRLARLPRGSFASSRGALQMGALGRAPRARHDGPRSLGQRRGRGEAAARAGGGLFRQGRRRERPGLHRRPRGPAPEGDGKARRGERREGREEEGRGQEVPGE
jgi:hypothetical protein